MDEIEVIGQWMPPGQREAFEAWARGVEERLTPPAAPPSTVQPPTPAGALRPLVPLGGSK